MNDPYGLASKAFLVTGASSGIGRGIAEYLGRAGAGIAVGYHSGGDRAREVVSAIEAAGGRAIAVKGDVSKEADVVRCFAEARDAFGPVTGCVACAGLQADAPFVDMSFEDWRKPMALDLDGAFLTAREFVRGLPEQAVEGTRARGSLVFISSVHEFIPWAGHVNYAAAKGGVAMFMRSIAQELGSQRVRANSIAPGATKTAINKGVWSDDAKRSKLLELVPYGRLGEPEDVAEATAWLLSDRSDYVTGVTLNVDGGMALYPGFIGNG